jgi:hypothetical protein
LIFDANNRLVFGDTPAGQGTGQVTCTAAKQLAGQILAGGMSGGMQNGMVQSVIQGTAKVMAHGREGFDRTLGCLRISSITFTA